MKATASSLCALLLACAVGCSAPTGTDGADSQAGAASESAATAPVDVAASPNTVLSEVLSSVSAYAPDETVWTVYELSKANATLGNDKTLVVTAIGGPEPRVWILDGAFASLGEASVSSTGKILVTAIENVADADGVQPTSIQLELGYSIADGALGEQLTVAGPEGSTSVAASSDLKHRQLASVLTVGDPVMIGDREVRAIQVQTDPDVANPIAVHLSVRPDGKPAQAFDLHIDLKDVEALDVKGTTIRVSGIAEVRAADGKRSSLRGVSYDVKVAADDVVRVTRR